MTPCRKATSSAVASVLLAGQFAGCSFLFLDAPPRPASASATAPDCHVASAAPSADLTLFGIGVIATMLTTVGLSDDLFDSGGDRMTRNEAIGLTIAASAVTAHGFSGVWGMHQVRRCRRLHGLPPDEDAP
jgi:hypothetical protein